MRWPAFLVLLVALVSGPPQTAHGETTEGDTLAPEAETSIEPSPLEVEPEDAQQVDTGEIFVTANTAYENGDHAKAIRLYSQLLDRGLDNGKLLYNLGNAYLRNGELGRAIAHYRASRRVLPRDEDVQANLAFARQSTKDAILPPEPTALLATLFFWHYALSPGQLIATVLILNLIFWSIWMVRIFHWDSEVLRWLFILLTALLVATAGSLGTHFLFPGEVAVIVPQEIGAHTAPDPDSVVRFKLHAGTEVEVESRRDGWLRIRLPDDQQGWIDAAWAVLVWEKS